MNPFDVLRQVPLFASLTNDQIAWWPMVSAETFPQRDDLSGR
jgi:hypothetical protein